MNPTSLLKISQKKKKLIIGLMSGTSLDGVDAVLVEVTGNFTGTKIKQIGFVSFPFPKGLKNKLLDNSSPNSGNVTDICRLNFLIPHIYIDAINLLCKKTKVDLNEVDLIGTHGQTIHHLPEKNNYYGYKFASTLQIGDISVLSNLTGKITIGDFRTADVALGGQGAPLVPYFDFVMFHSNKKNRALLNIGGISNFTILNKHGKAEDVFAFDTGPGNMMIDILAKKYFNVDYDKNGRIAFSGEVNEKLFQLMIEHDNYIERTPPKSTGREYYGKEFIAELSKKVKNVKKEDWITTASLFTAYAIYRNYFKFIKDETEIDELFVSGGGARNKFLMNELQKYFGKNVSARNLKNLGISPDAKEAICFAVLANETVSGNPSNIPRVTGAARPAILGKISIP